MDQNQQTANATPTFPPAGFVDQDAAARRLGVNRRTLRQWIKDGSLPYAGTMALRPNARRVRIYEVAALDAARQRMRAGVAARATLPQGFVDRAEAARMLGAVNEIFN